MIKFISHRNNEYADIAYDDFKLADLDEFKQWVEDKSMFQLDTETLFVPDTANVNEERKLVLIQIGDINKENQWLIEAQAVHNDPQLRGFFKTFFEDTDNSFIAHNAFFEYTVIKVAFDIRVENIHDTFLMSKILNTGYDLEDGYHSLAGCLQRFFGIEVDKEEQTKFTFDVLTESQIIYAATDVLHLYDLFVRLKELLEGWDLWFLYNRVEREVIKAYADMGINEMKFDLDHWSKLTKTLIDDDDVQRTKLNNSVIADTKLVDYLKTSSTVTGINLVQPKDKMDLNWGSNVARKQVLTKIIPDLMTLGRFTKPELKKIHKADVLTATENKILKLYLDRDFVKLNRYLRIHYKDWLYDNGYFLKKNDIRINWNSNIHKLYIFQFYYPHLENTNAKTLKRIHVNPLINTYKKYVKVHKSVTTYGEGFIPKYVTRKGTISPRGCRSILNTGRIALIARALL